MPVVTVQPRERRRTQAWLLLPALLLLVPLVALVPSAIYEDMEVRLRAGKFGLSMGRMFPYPGAGILQVEPTKWEPVLGITVRSGGITLGSWHYQVSWTVEEPQPPGVPMDRFIVW